MPHGGGGLIDNLAIFIWGVSYVLSVFTYMTANHEDYDARPWAIKSSQPRKFVRIGWSCSSADASKCCIHLCLKSQCYDEAPESLCTLIHIREAWSPLYPYMIREILFVLSVLAILNIWHEYPTLQRQSFDYMRLRDIVSSEWLAAHEEVPVRRTDRGRWTPMVT